MERHTHENKYYQGTLLVKFALKNVQELLHKHCIQIEKKTHHFIQTYIYTEPSFNLLSYQLSFTGSSEW